MLDEYKITEEAACAAMRVLEEEMSARIRHGDGDVELISEVIQALGTSDRIVIQTCQDV